MDNDDLEALFEATRAQAEREAGAACPSAAAARDAAAASLAAAATAGAAATAAAARAPNGEPVERCENADPDGVCRSCSCGGARELRDRVGRLTRELHESLQALRLDRALADVAVEIPDARNRLKFVTEMCERSAQKVLDTLDELSPLQAAARSESADLLARWDRLLGERRRPDEGYLALFEATREHLAASVLRAERSASLHTDIMMAQDFQDLTGQVCRKIEGITERIEAQLLDLLVDTAPGGDRQRDAESLAGPQVVADPDDAVSSQREVDDLLSSLGY